MQKTDWVWHNGKFIQWEEATVPFLSHSLHYSGSIFEGIRCYKTEKGPAIFRLEDHITRLFDSAKIIDMNVAWTKNNIIPACIETVKKNHLEECYIRPLLYYGGGEMGIDTLGKIADATIAVWKWGAYLGEGLETGIRIMTSSWRKPAPDSMPLNAKVSGNYTPAIMAKKEARKRGYSEALLLDPNGHVAEGPGENIFLVKNGVLFTPLTTYALNGITRDTILKLAEQEGIRCYVTSITRDQCYTADELFFTGTAAEITPIIEYDDRKIGTGTPGKITKRLKELFFSVVRGKSDSRWLTYA